MAATTNSCSAPRVTEADEQVLLDENVLAARTGFAEVGIREPSPDGTAARLVCRHQRSGDLRAADQGPPHRRGPARGRSPAATPGWRGAPLRTYLFYLVPDELNRPHQVWRHRVGAPASTDELVLEESDEKFELTLHASRSGELAIITAASRDTAEVRRDPVGQPARRSRPRRAAPPRRGVRGRSRPGRQPLHGHRCRSAGVHLDESAAGVAWRALGTRRLPGDRARSRPTPGCCDATCSPTTLS